MISERQFPSSRSKRRRRTALTSGTRRASKSLGSIALALWRQVATAKLDLGEPYCMVHEQAQWHKLKTAQEIFPRPWKTSHVSVVCKKQPVSLLPTPALVLATNGCVVLDLLGLANFLQCWTTSLYTDMKYRQPFRAMFCCLRPRIQDTTDMVLTDKSRLLPIDFLRLTATNFWQDCCSLAPTSWVIQAHEQRPTPVSQKQ